MSNDWIEHDGGPQPVDDDVWVEAYVALRDNPNLSAHQARKATFVDWPNVRAYRILNQHLIDAKQAEIDAARLEGIRLGLEAAVVEAQKYADKCRASGRFKVAMSFVTHAEDILALNPDTISRDVQTISHQEKCDNLHIAREAQDMGSGKET